MNKPSRRSKSLRRGAPPNTKFKNGSQPCMESLPNTFSPSKLANSEKDIIDDSNGSDQWVGIYSD